MKAFNINWFDPSPKFNFLRRSLLAIAVFVLAFGNHALAQQLTGTLSGTVFDQAEAAVPGATVVVRNEASGDTRTAVTNGSGFFSLTALQPATYTATITAKGFTTWQEPGIVMNVGDDRTIPNIKLKVGSTSAQVEVVSENYASVPLDTSEVSTTLSQTMINDFPLSGRDAGELLKIMPGMGLSNQASQGSAYNTKIVNTNSGPAGNYSANGTQPNGTMAYMLDGANLIDPGNAGTQIANINPDMVSQIKVLMSSYGAEYAKGPVIFSAFSKSGGQQFHGEGYLYTRNSALNSVDSFTKSQGGTNANESYYYMGGNIGGPVILPHLGFNKNRNKLFFWGGYEYMKQQPAGTPLNYNVPTPAQLSGDFSNTGVPALAIKAWPQAYGVPYELPPGATATSLPAADVDPNIKGFLKFYPKPNETPSLGNGWNNYSYTEQVPTNRWEATGKVDYSISENTKVTGSYTRQEENDQHPITIWWAYPWTLPYPSDAVAPTVAQVILGNVTHVFNPTTTNEFVVTYAKYVNQSTLTDPKAVDRSTIGFNTKGLFGHTTNHMPNVISSWSPALPNIDQYSFDSGPFGGTKQTPAIYDNFTKVVGPHSVKIGFYWDAEKGEQGNINPDNGQYQIGYANNSTGNWVMDLLNGRPYNYQQQSSLPISNLQWHLWSIYAQDSFKASRQLTVNYGLRLDHVGQWYGSPVGQQVWSPSTYDNTASAPANTGLTWHALDKSVPLSGFPSKLFEIDPRLGLAYDVFGTGKTVFRGGLAYYRYQSSANSALNLFNGPLGSYTYTTYSTLPGYDASNPGVTGYNSIAAIAAPPSTGNENGSSVFAIQRGDNKVPTTVDWNVTISQALPWRSVFEISYVANRSYNLYEDGNGSNYNNLNNPPPGAFFRPDPVTGLTVSPAPPSCPSNSLDPSLYCTNDPTHYEASFNASDFYKYRNSQAIYLQTHGGYSRYNSMQLSYQKQSGPVYFVTNYTFGKVLGTRDQSGDNGNSPGPMLDPFNLRSSYGPIAFDHTQILNLSGSWNLPKPIHGQGWAAHVAGGAVNGWQLSTYTAFQSGAPLQSNIATLNAIYASGLTVPTVAHRNLPDNSIKLPNGLVATNVSANAWLGSNAYANFFPALTCDPRKGLKSGYYFNPACFTTPAYGTNGGYWPYIHLPAYWTSDLGIYKNFQVTESQRFQFRVSASNWLNHALPQFGLANSQDEQLNFQSQTNATCAGCVAADGKTPLQVNAISPTNTNENTTGKPAFKTGSRSLLFSAKYYF
jgi:hypothetical protein